MGNINENKIMNSLKIAAILNCGQPLRVLVKEGFGEIGDCTIKTTQKILQKWQSKGIVSYCNRVWYLTKGE